MTKRDYELIAQALADARPSRFLQLRHDQWHEDVTRIVVALRVINPRFDHERFITWCETH